MCIDPLLLEERSRQVNYLHIQALPPTLPPSLPHTHHSRAGPPLVLLQIGGNRTANHPFGFGYSPLSSGILGSSRTHPMEAFQVRSNVLLCIKSCCRHPNLSPSCRNWCGYLQRCTYLLTSHGCSPDLIQFLIRSQWFRLLYYTTTLQHSYTSSRLATVAHTIYHQSVLQKESPCLLHLDKT